VISNRFRSQKWLGKTISGIAAEKAGNHQTRVPMISACAAPEAEK